MRKKFVIASACIAYELYIFFQYVGHEAGIHYWLHALTGLVAAMFTFTFLRRRGYPAGRVWWTAFLLHQYAMIPDYLYELGVPHAAWMNVFLGHVWVDSIPYHEVILPVVALGATTLYWYTGKK